MIIVTGAAGFIGSCLLGHLSETGFSDLVGVDDFSITVKENNHRDKKLLDRVDRQRLIPYLEKHSSNIEFVVHLGARTDTVDPDPIIFKELNLDYSISLAQFCSEYGIPFIYASSAATYGDGAFGFDDRMDSISKLRPLNEYGRSKQYFDEWMLTQKELPPYWIGLKFFNVYGPNEYHKGRMASVIFHAYRQIMNTGAMKLFRSHKEDYEDGMQLRDFIFVKDICTTIEHLIKKKIESGIYNLGTGQARSFLDLVNGVFKALDQKSSISFIDIPEDIRANYQYFTEAKMSKLSSQGIPCDFTSLEDGIADYVRNYLLENKYL